MSKKNKSNKKCGCEKGGIDEFIKESFMKGGAVVHVKLSDAAYQETAPEMVEGYTLNKEFGNAKTRVYMNDAEKKIIIAHRGTVPSDPKDLRQDALILAGKLSPETSSRVNAAKEIALAVQAKYPDYEITNTGHSLGGRVAKDTAKALSIKNSKVEAYNSGSSVADVPGAIADKIKCAFSNSAECKKLKQVTENTTGIDPISLFATGKKKFVLPKSLNVHSIANF